MTSRLREMKENGWRPGKSSSSSSSSGGSKGTFGIRNKVSGLVHGNSSGSNDGPTHVARPMRELRDPSSFAPPPKRTASGLAPPPPPSNIANRQVVAAPSKYQDPRGPPVEPPPRNSHSPEELEYRAQQARLRGEPEDEEPPAPRGPYRVDTTGLSTDHLPRPPGRRDGADGRSPPPPSYETATNRPALPAPPTSKPSLPPRLPPRTNTSSTATGPASPQSSNLLNQGAVNRLGAAGVSVPGFGIGQSGAASASPSPPPPPPTRQPNAQVSELQNRFSNLKTTNNWQSRDEQPQQRAPAEGTTWAQKQAALKTASSFQKDPSSVSLSDAKAAVGTANNFRERHGDQVASGVRSANSLNQKYGVTNKIAGYGAGQQQQEGNQASTTSGGMGSAVAGLAGKKKPPPPPPKKKPGLAGSAVSTPAPADDEPPPIPMSTRPTF
ncbi:hypothetical protein ACO1O0_007967 [Amphichorda felina]